MEKVDSISEIDKNKLPTKFITVEAVVTLNQGQKWGSIASYAQDNGSYERGWLLGYNEQSFYSGSQRVNQ